MIIWWVVVLAALGGLYSAIRARAIRGRKHPEVSSEVSAELVRRADQQNRWALRGDPRGVWGAKGAELMRSNGVPSWSRGCMTINSATRAPSGERAPGGAEVGRFVLDRMDELLTLVSEVESLMLNQSRHRRDRAGNHADRDRRRLGSLTTRWCPARSQRCSTPGWTTSTAPGLSQPLSSCTAATPATPALSRSRT
jgi:hypothetical protein